MNYYSNYKNTPQHFEIICHSHIWFFQYGWLSVCKQGNFVFRDPSVYFTLYPIFTAYCGNFWLQILLSIFFSLRISAIVSVNSLNICILSIYRAPSSNFVLFLDKLEMILNLIQNNNTQLIICGDININYFVENNKKNPSGLFAGLLQPD